jgi:hypothetical protein
MILGKKFFDWTIMGGATIIPRSLKTTRNEKIFELGQKMFKIFFFIYEPFVWVNTSFSKIRSINCARDGFMRQSWQKCQNLFPLVSD